MIKIDEKKNIPLFDFSKLELVFVFIYFCVHVCVCMCLCKCSTDLDKESTQASMQRLLIVKVIKTHEMFGGFFDLQVDFDFYFLNSLIYNRSLPL